MSLDPQRRIDPPSIQPRPKAGLELAWSSSADGSKSQLITVFL